DDSQTTNFSTFSNPLFNDSVSSDDESSHEEVIHEMSFKTYLNPLFDLDEEIISIEFNPIHNEDLDSTPKNDRFDTKSYLLESLLNLDESIPPGINSDDSDSEWDTLSLERLLHDDPIPLSDTLDFSIDVRVFLPFFTYPLSDDDDDEESSNSLNDNISELPPYSAVTPSEPVDPLSMGDEHLDTIPAMESNQLIKSGVETLIPIPSESEGIPEHVCDVPSHDNSPPPDISKDTIEDLSESNKEFSSTDDDSFSLDNIDYVEASPPDSELVSSEVMEIVILEVGGIKASTDNPIPSYDPIISGTPLNLTSSGESDFFLEVDSFLAVEDESTSSQFPKSDLDPEGDMLLFEAFLNDDHSSNSQTKSSSTSLNSFLEETRTFDNSLPEVTTFSNDPCDAECESDDQSYSDEDVLEKIVSLFDEFAGELTLLKSIPPGIDETDCHPEEEIRLTKRLFIPGSMKILSNGFHYLKSSYSPLFNLGITYPYLID
nr:hypothetical protein [Tanacetum cinerariifolium]